MTKISRREMLKFAGTAVGAGVVASAIQACAPSVAPTVATPVPAAPAATTAPKPAEQEQLYFRLVTHGGDDPFWAVVKQGMMDAAALYGVQGRD